MADFESRLSKATARGSNITTGIVLSAISSTGEEIYSKASGYNGLSSSAPPITKEATFWVASCTKLATSIAALQCVENGLVGLDDPVEKWIPQLASRQILTQEDGQFKSVEAKNKITLRQLLTHTSGFAYDFSHPVLLAWRSENPLTRDMPSLITTLYDHPLVFEPGTGWYYGPGIDWAGILVENLHGITLGDYFHKEIFGRLGVSGSSTTFHLDSPAAKAAKIQERLLPNAERQPDGTLAEKPNIYSGLFKGDSGGGGWYSSVGDYMQILQDLISPEPKLLKKENLEKWLFAGHISDKKVIHDLLTARTGMTPQDEGDVAGAPINHSLGGLLWVEDGLMPKGTLNWGGLPNLKWFANREKGIAAMFATQVTPYGDEQAQDLAAAYFEEVWRIYGESSK